jgi:hypothetical protein
LPALRESPRPRHRPRRPGRRARGHPIARGRSWASPPDRDPDPADPRRRIGRSWSHWFNTECRGASPSASAPRAMLPPVRHIIPPHPRARGPRAGAAGPPKNRSPMSPAAASGAPAQVFESRRQPRR